MLNTLFDKLVATHQAMSQAPVAGVDEVKRRNELRKDLKKSFEALNECLSERKIDSERGQKASSVGVNGLLKLVPDSSKKKKEIPLLFSLCNGSKDPALLEAVLGNEAVKTGLNLLLSYKADQVNMIEYLVDQINLQKDRNGVQYRNCLGCLRVVIEKCEVAVLNSVLGDRSILDVALQRLSKEKGAEHKVSNFLQDWRKIHEDIQVRKLSGKQAWHESIDSAMLGVKNIMTRAKDGAISKKDKRDLENSVKLLIKVEVHAELDYVRSLLQVDFKPSDVDKLDPQVSRILLDSVINGLVSLNNRSQELNNKLNQFRNQVASVIDSSVMEDLIERTIIEARQTEPQDLQHAFVSRMQDPLRPSMLTELLRNAIKRLPHDGGEREYVEQCIAALLAVEHGASSGANPEVGGILKGLLGSVILKGDIDLLNGIAMLNNAESREKINDLLDRTSSIQSSTEIFAKFNESGGAKNMVALLNFFVVQFDARGDAFKGAILGGLKQLCIREGILHEVMDGIKEVEALHGIGNEFVQRISSDDIKSVIKSASLRSDDLVWILNHSVVDPADTAVSIDFPIKLRISADGKATHDAELSLALSSIPGRESDALVAALSEYKRRNPSSGAIDDEYRLLNPAPKGIRVVAGQVSEQNSWLEILKSVFEKKLSFGDQSLQNASHVLAMCMGETRNLLDAVALRKQFMEGLAPVEFDLEMARQFAKHNNGHQSSDEGERSAASFLGQSLEESIRRQFVSGTYTREQYDLLIRIGSVLGSVKEQSQDIVKSLLNEAIESNDSAKFSDLVRAFAPFMSDRSLVVALSDKMVRSGHYQMAEDFRLMMSEFSSLKKGSFTVPRLIHVNPASSALKASFPRVGAGESVVPEVALAARAAFDSNDSSANVPQKGESSVDLVEHYSALRKQVCALPAKDCHYPFSEFIHSIKNSKVVDLKNLFKNKDYKDGAIIGEVGANGHDLRTWVAAFSNPEVLEIVLENWGKVDSANVADSRVSADPILDDKALFGGLLHCAVEAKNFSVIEYLVSHDSRVMLKVDGGGSNPLHVACMNKDVDALRIIFSSVASKGKESYSKFAAAMLCSNQNGQAPLAMCLGNDALFEALSKAISLNPPGFAQQLVCEINKNPGFANAMLGEANSCVYLFSIFRVLQEKLGDKFDPLALGFSQGIKASWIGVILEKGGNEDYWRLDDLLKNSTHVKRSKDNLFQALTLAFANSNVSRESIGKIFATLLPADLKVIEGENSFETSFIKFALMHRDPASGRNLVHVLCESGRLDLLTGILNAKGNILKSLGSESFKNFMNLFNQEDNRKLLPLELAVESAMRVQGGIELFDKLLQGWFSEKGVSDSAPLSRKVPAASAEVSLLKIISNKPSLLATLSEPGHCIAASSLVNPSFKLSDKVALDVFKGLIGNSIVVQNWLSDLKARPVDLANFLCDPLGCITKSRSANALSLLEVARSERAPFNVEISIIQSFLGLISSGTSELSDEQKNEFCKQIIQSNVEVYPLINDMQNKEALLSLLCTYGNMLELGNKSELDTIMCKLAKISPVLLNALVDNEAVESNCFRSRIGEIMQLDPLPDQFVELAISVSALQPSGAIGQSAWLNPNMNANTKKKLIQLLEKSENEHLTIPFIKAMINGPLNQVNDVVRDPRYHSLVDACIQANRVDLLYLMARDLALNKKESFIPLSSLQADGQDSAIAAPLGKKMLQAMGGKYISHLAALLADMDDLPPAQGDSHPRGFSDCLGKLKEYVSNTTKDGLLTEMILHRVKCGREVTGKDLGHLKNAYPYKKGLHSKLFSVGGEVKMPEYADELKPAFQGVAEVVRAWDVSRDLHYLQVKDLRDRRESDSGRSDIPSEEYKDFCGSSKLEWDLRDPAKPLEEVLQELLLNKSNLALEDPISHKSVLLRLVERVRDETASGKTVMTADNSQLRKNFVKVLMRGLVHIGDKDDILAINNEIRALEVPQVIKDELKLKFANHIALRAELSRSLQTIASDHSGDKDSANPRAFKKKCDAINNYISSSQYNDPDGEAVTVSLNNVLRDLISQYFKNVADSHDGIRVDANKVIKAKIQGILQFDQKIAGVVDSDGNNILHHLLSKADQVPRHLRNDTLRDMLKLASEEVDDGGSALLKQKNHFGYTPIHLMIGIPSGSMELLNSLTNKSANSKREKLESLCKSIGRASLVKYAFQTGSRAWLDALLHQGEIYPRADDANVTDFSHEKPIFGIENETGLKLAIAEGVDFDTLDSEGRNVLHRYLIDVLCHRKKLSIPFLKALISNGCSLNKADRGGMNALWVLEALESESKQVRKAYNDLIDKVYKAISDRQQGSCMPDDPKMLLAINDRNYKVIGELIGNYIGKEDKARFASWRDQGIIDVSAASSQRESLDKIVRDALGKRAQREVALSEKIKVKGADYAIRGGLLSCVFSPSAKVDSTHLIRNVLGDGNVPGVGATAMSVSFGSAGSNYMVSKHGDKRSYKVLKGMVSFEFKPKGSLFRKLKVEVHADGKLVCRSLQGKTLESIRKACAGLDNVFIGGLDLATVIERERWANVRVHTLDAMKRNAVETRQDIVRDDVLPDISRDGPATLVVPESVTQAQNERSVMPAHFSASPGDDRLFNSSTSSISVQRGGPSFQ